jgi:hypothetical protein
MLQTLLYVIICGGSSHGDSNDYAVYLQMYWCYTCVLEHLITPTALEHLITPTALEHLITPTALDYFSNSKVVVVREKARALGLDRLFAFVAGLWWPVISLLGIRIPERLVYVLGLTYVLCRS